MSHVLFWLHIIPRTNMEYIFILYLYIIFIYYIWVISCSTFMDVCWGGCLSSGAGNSVHGVNWPFGGKTYLQIAMFGPFSCAKDHNPNLCRELHRILRCDPFTVKGACQLLQLSADSEEAQVKKVREELKQKLAKAQLQAGEETSWKNTKKSHKRRWSVAKH